MSYLKTFSILAGAIALTFSTTGCGGHSYYKEKANTKPTGRVLAETADPFSNPLPNPSPSPTSSPTAPTGIPPITFRVGTTGYNSTSITVQANRVLRVKFTPGVQDEKIAGTGYVPNYSLLGVYIEVGTASKPTEMLYNGFFGGQAETGAVLDFSSSFSKTCPANDPLCRQTVTITISQPNNDFNCLNYNIYCPYSRVNDGQPWHGTLSVQTDDTDPI